MPNESEACVESGSGHGIDARAGFSGVWCGLLKCSWRMFVFVDSSVSWRCGQDVVEKSTVSVKNL